MNLNLRHIADQQVFPSQLEDSPHQQASGEWYPSTEPIRAQLHYELNASIASSSRQQPHLIDNSLEDSFIQHDNFLAMVREEAKQIQNNQNDPLVVSLNQKTYLVASRSNIKLTLMQTQIAHESITFSNSSSQTIRMKFNHCPFQISSARTLNYLLSQQLQVILQPWQQLEITFLIKPQSQEYGDIIQNSVITASFIERPQAITPINISFRVHYVTPRIRLNYQGASDWLRTRDGQLPVVKLSANKMGVYELQIGMLQGLDRLQCNVQTKGKLTCLSRSIVLNSSQSSLLKLRRRGGLNEKQKSALVLRPVNSQLCFVWGVQLI